MANNDLKKKAASGMVWTALQKYSTMIISFISGIILARLLTPFDYGCIGMLSIFMVLARTFIDGGFASALIQKKNPSKEDYSTIFFWNLSVSVVMYATLYLTAPAIARFYDIPILSSVLRVQALVLFVNAFKLVQSNQLRKKLNFKLIAIVTVITSLISLTVTILMAYKGFGVWALVSSNLISATIPAVVYWLYVKWRPVMTFSWKSFEELFSFGFFMFLTHLVNNFGSQLQGLLIGKVYNPATMGYYSKAHGTEKLASQSISSVMTQVTYPLYAQVQDDKVALANMIKRLTSTLAFVTFPLMFILLLLAKPIFVLLYSDRWLQSVPYFQVLCVSGLAACLQAVNLQSISAIGKSGTMFLWTLLKRCVGIGLIVGGLAYWGMKGLLIGFVMNSWFAYWVNILLVSKHIGYKWYRQLQDLFPIMLVAVLAAAISWGVGCLCGLSMYLDALVKFVVYVVIYMGWALLRKPEAYTYTLSIIPGRFKFGERKKTNLFDAS
jgi:O-antigen/teichoic acid export membrane protein